MTYGLTQAFGHIAPPVWQQLKLGTGGLVTNLDLNSDGTMVGTTDSFGAYVWTTASNKWTQLLNTSTISGLPQEGGGTDCIKLAPSNSAIIWLSYTGSFYKSIDRGNTFTLQSGYTVAALSANNGSPCKSFGPYIAIDPNNANVVYISTPAQGVQRTLDGGTTWATVAETNSGFPAYINNTPTLRVNTTSTTSLTISNSTSGAVSFTTAGSIGYNAGQSYVKGWRTSDTKVNFYGLLSGSGTSYTITVPAGSAFGDGIAHTDWSFSPIIDGNNGANGGGGHCIVFDTSPGTPTLSTGTGIFSGVTRTKNIYVSAYGVGVYFSNDGGQTWSLLNSAGMPVAIRRMRVSSTGVLWTLDDMYQASSNVTRYASGTWTLIFTNHGGGAWYSSLDVDPANANRIVVIQNDQPSVEVTTDGGTTWITSGGLGNRTVNSAVAAGVDVDWLADFYTFTLGFANCDVQFDPNGGNKIWMGAEGVFYCTIPTVNAQSIALTIQSRGIEQFIGNKIMSLPGDSGSVLASTWDIPVFKTSAPDSYPLVAGGVEGHSALNGLMRGYSFDYLWSDPTKVVGIIQSGSTADTSGYSTTKGNNSTWTAFTAKPNVQAQGGHIAIFDTNSAVWVTAGVGNDGTNFPPKETSDYTANPVVWTTISIPGGTPLYGWQPNGNSSTYSQSVVSDKTNGDIYLFNVNTGATSSNPGASAMFKRTKATGAWSIVKSPFDFTGELNFNAKMTAIPGSYGLAGAMWFTGGNGAAPHPNAGRPLYWTTNGWSTSSSVTGFTECAAVGFGVSFPGNTGYPTVFVAGWYTGTATINGSSQSVTNTYGVWMCKNFNTGTGAGTWILCGSLGPDGVRSFPSNIVGVVSDIDGDKTIPGRVYLQTQASGAFYGTFS